MENTRGEHDLPGAGKSPFKPWETPLGPAEPRGHVKDASGSLNPSVFETVPQSDAFQESPPPGKKIEPEEFDARGLIPPAAGVEKIELVPDSEESPAGLPHGAARGDAGQSPDSRKCPAHVSASPKARRAGFPVFVAALAVCALAAVLVAFGLVRQGLRETPRPRQEVSQNPYASPLDHPVHRAEVAEARRVRDAKASEALSRAHSDFKARRYNEALAGAREASRHLPRSYAAHKLAGSALYCLGDHESAAYHFKSAFGLAQGAWDRDWSAVMYLICAREARIAEAESEFLRMSPPLTASPGSGPEFRIAAGIIPPEEGARALEASGAWKSPSRSASVGFFAGVGFLRAGNAVLASECFAKSAGSGAGDEEESHFARVALDACAGKRGGR